MAEDAEAPTRLDGKNARTPWQGLNKIFGDRTAQENARHLLPYLQPDSHILDIGCGLGTITIGLADLVPQGEVIGIDSNPTTTQLAEDLAKERGTRNVKFQVVDVNRLAETFGPESFDIVHAHQVILHLPNRLNVIKEARKLLKPGGLFTTRDNITIHVWPNDEGVDDAFQAICKAVEKLGADLSVGKRTHVWAHEAGFPWENIRVEFAAFGYSTLEDRRIWAEAMSANYKHLSAAGAQAMPAEDMRDVQEKWAAWADNPAGTMYGLDGVVLAWK